ncbi:hypothetical protein PAHAL_7G234100 [Panicum hallii]|uniref:Uncharacterized protein n=1 Tax=Panicum hallii TaxID=206008 RepID=A0A2S3I8Q3_9POAL|nr:hypothetical protein PAHAL_7G234100 [Panicum hallii]
MLFKITEGKGCLGSWMIFQGFCFTVHCPMNEYAALMVICPQKQNPLCCPVYMRVQVVGFRRSDLLLSIMVMKF